MLKVSEIKKQIDKKIIGHDHPKEQILTAIMQRVKRLNIENDNDRKKILPYNILIKGPSGSGKTYTIEVISELLDIPFYKTSLTQYSETGYVGKNVEDIVKDLYNSMKDKLKKMFINRIIEVPEIKEMVASTIVPYYVSQTKNDEKDIKEINRKIDSINDLIDDIIGDVSFDDNNTSDDYDDIKNKIINNDKDIMNTIIEMPVLKEMMVNTPFGKQYSPKKIIVNKPIKELIYDVCETFLYKDEKLFSQYKEYVKEQLENAIIFLDEVDKIADRDGERVSRGGVQNGLLTLISGSEIYIEGLDDVINTKHMLFIAAGAFQSGVNIADLKDEFIGRFPLLIELQPLTEEEYYRILKNAEDSVLQQHILLLKKNNIEVSIDDEVLKQIAKYTFELNNSNNIGARRLTAFVVEIFRELVYYSYEELIEMHKKGELKKYNSKLKKNKLYVELNLDNCKDKIEKIYNLPKSSYRKMIKL